MAQFDTHVLRGEATLDDLDMLISDAGADPRAAFGLNAAKATAQEASGDLLGAAETLQSMAALVEKHPESSDTELYTLYLEAAELLSEAQALKSSREAYFGALNALTNSAGDTALQNRITTAIADISARMGEVGFADNLIESTDEISLFTAPPTPPPQPDDPGFVRIPVHYATDRAQSGKDWPAQFYGADRGAGLARGVAMVTVPRTVAPEAFPAPAIWRVEFRSEPARQAITQSVTSIDTRGFFASLRALLETQRAGDVFVYVPAAGANFSDAARQAAELTEAMRFAGVPLLYSWASVGLPTSYLADSAAAEASAANLARFLTDVAARSDARRVHVIAHGLGNAALALALEIMADGPQGTVDQTLGQVIFAAPDMDRARFAQNLEKARAVAERMTVYVSDQDRTLTDVQGLFDTQKRAGGAKTPVRGDAFDTVDMSAIGPNLLDRAVNSGQPSGILDIATLFWNSPDTARRCGLTEGSEGKGVWVMEPADCAGPSTLNAIATLGQADARSAEAMRDVLARHAENHPDLRRIESLLLNMATTD